MKKKIKDNQQKQKVKVESFETTPRKGEKEKTKKTIRHLSKDIENRQRNKTRLH